MSQSPPISHPETPQSPSGASAIASPSVDLSAYFRRIGYSGPREATEEVLRELNRLHPAAIPFENVDSLCGRAVSIDLSSLQSKLIDGGRGGYCFEHNLLFKAVLQQIGFSVRGVVARVRWSVQPGVVRPRTHMALLVRCGDSDKLPQWLVDVGFAHRLLTGPLLFDAECATDMEPQDTPNDRMRIRPAPEDGPYEFDVQVETERSESIGHSNNREWRDLFRFSLAHYDDVDFEAVNMFVQRPAAPLLTSLFVSRVQPQFKRTVTLLDTLLKEWPFGGAQPTERNIRSREELKTVLQEEIGLDYSTADAAAGRVAAKVQLK